MFARGNLLSSIKDFNKTKLLKTRKTSHELIVPFPSDQLPTNESNIIPIIHTIPAITFTIKQKKETKSFVITYEILSTIIHFLPFKDCFHSFSFLNESIFITSIIVHVVRYSSCVKGFLMRYINSVEKSLQQTHKDLPLKSEIDYNLFNNLKTEEEIKTPNTLRQTVEKSHIKDQLLELLERENLTTLSLKKSSEKEISLDGFCPYVFCILASFSGLKSVKKDLKNDNHVMMILQKHSSTRPEICELIKVIEQER